MDILKVLFFGVLIIGLVQVSKCEEENDEQENVDEGIDETTGELDENYDEEDSSNDEENEEKNDNASREDGPDESKVEQESSKDVDAEHQNVQSDDPMKAHHSTAQECQTIDKSEMNKLCANNWTARIYYDPGQKLWERCQFFYYGGCSSMKREFIFDNEAECFNKCESKETMDCNFYHSSKYCFGEYDPSKWTLFYTHDPVQGKCIQSWHGGCSIFNVYKTLEQCQQKCEKNSHIRVI